MVIKAFRAWRAEAKRQEEEEARRREEEARQAREREEEEARQEQEWEEEARREQEWLEEEERKEQEWHERNNLRMLENERRKEFAEKQMHKYEQMALNFAIQLPDSDLGQATDAIVIKSLGDRITYGRVCGDDISQSLEQDESFWTEDLNFVVNGNKWMRSFFLYDAITYAQARKRNPAAAFPPRPAYALVSRSTYNLSTKRPTSASIVFAAHKYVGIFGYDNAGWFGGNFARYLREYQYHHINPLGDEVTYTIAPNLDIVHWREHYRCRLPRGSGINTLPVFPAKPQDGEPGGYIYVAGTDDSDVVKIGMTIRPPDERLRELNNTSVYDDFKLRMVYQTPNALRAEQIIHRALAEYRVRKDREFFRVPMEKVREVFATGAGEGPLV